jgi:L,D-transpeptidase YcbB
MALDRKAKPGYINGLTTSITKESQVSLRNSRECRNGWLILLALLFILTTQTSRGESPATASPDPSGSPTADAIKVLLASGSHPELRWGKFSDFQDPLEQLYQGNGYQPVWFKDGKAISQARSVIDALASANSHGLDAADYDVDWLRGRLGKPGGSGDPNPQKLASVDLAINLAAMRFATNLHGGRIDPRQAGFGLGGDAETLDLTDLIRRLAASDHPEEIFAGLESQLRLYSNLKAALARYTRLTQEQQPGPITLPEKFKPGENNASVRNLRKMLILLGDLEDGGKDTDTYDKALAEGVKSFQRRHGLAADGVIGKGTLTQLNTPIATRIRQIELALERLRWLPSKIDGRYIIVNVPSFQLFGFNDGLSKPEVEMNVIVGEAANGRNTPVFHADMTYVNFRPYWNVPYKITTKEYLPIIVRNPGYLASHNLEIVANFAPNTPVYEPSLDHFSMLSSGALKLRQKPGPKNALGLVKFTFPNNNNVYLHSTPTPQLFKKSRRDFSHGCIRVEHPVELAEFVLSAQGGDWTREKIETSMQGDKSKIVTLKTALPVYIFYSTALADENGKGMFFEDIYGHDEKLQTLLAKGFPHHSNRQVAKAEEAPAAKADGADAVP